MSISKPLCCQKENAGQQQSECSPRIRTENCLCLDRFRYPTPVPFASLPGHRGGSSCAVGEHCKGLACFRHAFAASMQRDRQTGMSASCAAPLSRREATCCPSAGFVVNCLVAITVDAHRLVGPRVSQSACELSSLSAQVALGLPMGVRSWFVCFRFPPDASVGQWVSAVVLPPPPHPSPVSAFRTASFCRLLPACPSPLVRTGRSTASPPGGKRVGSTSMAMTTPSSRSPSPRRRTR